MAVSAFRPEAAKRRSMNPNNNGEHHGNQDDQHHHHRHHHHRHHHQQQQQQQQQHHQQQQQQHQQQQHHHPQHRRRHHHQQDDQLDPHRRMIPCTSSSPPNRTIYTSKLDPPPCPADRIDRNDPRGRVHARSRQHCDLRPRPSHELERSNRAGYHERQGSSLSEQYPDAQVEEKFVLSVHPQNDQETSSERVSQDISKFSRPVFSEEILELFKYVCKFYMAKVEKAEEEVGELRRQLVDQRLKYMNLRGIVDRFMSDRGYKEYADGLHGIGSRSNRDLDTDGNASEEEAEVDSAEEEEEEDDDDDDGGDDDDGDDDRVIGCEVSSRSDRIAVPDPSSEDDHSTSDSNMDGLVLPWLRWDATNNSTLSIHSGQRSTRQKQEASVCPQSCDEVAAFSKVGQKENHGFAKLRQRQVCDGIGEEKGSAERDRSVLPADNAHVEPIDEMPSSETCFVHAGNAERMSERIRFQSRIESRELLLCIGMLHYNAF